MPHPNYSFTISIETKELALAYFHDIKKNPHIMGSYLKSRLDTLDLAQLTFDDFMFELINTKIKGYLFGAETYMPYIEQYRNHGEVFWNETESQILTQITSHVNAKAYDNGVWYSTDPKFKEHTEALDVTFIYMPGMVLKKGSPYYDKIVIEHSDGSREIDQDKFNKHFETIALPALLKLNQQGEINNEDYITTLSGVGTGCFCELDLQDQAKVVLEKFAIYLLEHHGDKLRHIKGIYYDDFKTEEKKEIEINGIDLITHSSGAPGGQSLLCNPFEYGDRYQNCKLATIVAWDPYAAHGNDSLDNTRFTNDGVMTLASNVYTQVTGIEGYYNTDKKKFLPNSNRNWGNELENNQFQFEAELTVYDSNTPIESIELVDKYHNHKAEIFKLQKLNHDISEKLESITDKTLNKHYNQLNDYIITLQKVIAKNYKSCEIDSQILDQINLIKENLDNNSITDITDKFARLQSLMFNEETPIGMCAYVHILAGYVRLIELINKISNRIEDQPTKKMLFNILSQELNDKKSSNGCTLNLTTFKNDINQFERILSHKQFGFRSHGDEDSLYLENKNHISELRNDFGITVSDADSYKNLKSKNPECLTYKAYLKNHPQEQDSCCSFS